MGLSPKFERLLSDRREAFNARVAAARTRSSGFDTAAFGTFLEEQADPLLNAALAHDEGAGARLSDAIFDASIALTEHRWVGQGTRALLVRQIWSDVLPQYARVIAKHPKATIATLSNAAIKASQEPGFRVDQWCKVLASLGEDVTTLDQTRDLVVIAAWRSGMAHVRDAALTAADRLPSGLACAAVGANDNWQAIAQKFAAHQWWAPDKPDVGTGHSIGAFSGFGGYFDEPPTLSVAHDMFEVASGDLRFALYVDAYGATLRPIGAQNKSTKRRQAPPAGSRLNGKTIRADDRMVPILMPETELCIAETSDSIAVSSPYSHRIQVFPKVLP